MKGTVELKRPILIDGKEVKELSYDTDKISVELYLKAVNAAMAKGNGITGINIKVDAGVQLMIGLYSVVAENPAYDITDVERVTGADLMNFVDIGRTRRTHRPNSSQKLLPGVPHKRHRAQKNEHDRIPAGNKRGRRRGSETQ